MTTFEDGPAQGQTLILQRAPVFLRVVNGSDGWDALDQLSDSPRRSEKLYACKITGEPGRCHLNFGGGRGGWYVIATYALIEDQPSDTTMRAMGSWRAWCEKFVSASSRNQRAGSPRSPE